VAAIGGTALAADHAVAISGFSFSPGDITVTVGDTVTWTNADSTAHTATADDGSFDTGTLGGGASDTVTFATAGTFAYHCSIHAAMTGTVVVQAAGAGGGATQPPTDTVDLPATGSNDLATSLVLTLAVVVGLIVAARRFARG
jgi:plastocyanin